MAKVKFFLAGFFLILLFLAGGCARVVSGIISRVISIEIELAGPRDSSGYYYFVVNTSGQVPLVPNPLRGYFYTPDDPAFQFSQAADYLPSWTHYVFLGPEGYYKIVKGPFVAGGSWPPEYLEIFSGSGNKFKIQFTLSRFGVEQLNSIAFNLVTVDSSRQIIDKLGFDYMLSPVQAGVSVNITPESGDAFDTLGQSVPSLDIVGGIVRIE